MPLVVFEFLAFLFRRLKNKLTVADITRICDSHDAYLPTLSLSFLCVESRDLDIENSLTLSQRRGLPLISRPLTYLTRRTLLYIISSESLLVTWLGLGIICVPIALDSTESSGMPYLVEGYPSGKELLTISHQGMSVTCPIKCFIMPPTG